MLLITWIGIIFCVSQSAMFSGLNLAFFSISKLRLEIEVSQNNKDATKILAMRQDSNFLLTTILWGNVGINVLLTLLSNSVMVGLVAFVFSTFIITFFGEIIPQAYFSRNALRMASLLSPLLRFYQILLFPVAKPSALVLDKWLGPEAIRFFREKDLEEVIKMHMNHPETDIHNVEGIGALNFLAIDDITVNDEGELIDPKSIMSLQFEDNKPIFPVFEFSTSDSFLQLIQSCEKKWMVITDPSGEPRVVLNSDSFLRAALFRRESFNPYLHCHRPVIIKRAETTLGETIPLFKVHPERSEDDVIDQDIMLFWGEQKRIIAGSDILGRLLRGIVKQEKVHFHKVVDEKA